MNIGNNWSRLRSPDMINFPKRLVDQKRGQGQPPDVRPHSFWWPCVCSGPAPNTSVKCLLSFSWITSLQAFASPPFNRKKDTGYRWLSASNTPDFYPVRGGSFAVKYADLAYEHKKKTKRKEQFLAEMEAILPWDELLKPIVKKYPKAGQGRRPVPAEVMLRIYFLQQWYGLSDPGMEDSLYDVESIRRFAGVTLESVLDDGFEAILYLIVFMNNY